MRILISTVHRNLVGGVEKYLQAVIPGLANRRHEIGILHENRFDAALEAIDPSGFDGKTCCVAGLGIQASLRFVSGWKPDVIYCHGIETNELRAALLKSYPSVLFAHNYFGTCATGQKSHAFPMLRPCERKFGLGCLLLHYPRRCGGLNPVTMWRMFQSSAEMNRELPQYSAVLVASSHMYREFQRHGVSAARIHLVPLPNPQSALDRPPRRTAASGRILFLGRLTKLKGASHLLRAIPLAARALSRSLAVTVAGDGPERPKLEMLARKLGLSVEFTGWISGDSKTRLVRDADLLAVPSLWPEPFGLVGIEAGALGLPAVAYQVGGIPDWLIPGKSGELAPADPPTIEGFAHAIVRALADPQHHADLCTGAWEIARRFSLEQHLSSIESIFETVRLGNASNQAPIAEDIHA